MFIIFSRFAAFLSAILFIVFILIYSLSLPTNADVFIKEKVASTSQPMHEPTVAIHQAILYPVVQLVALKRMSLSKRCLTRLGKKNNPCANPACHSYNSVPLILTNNTAATIATIGRQGRNMKAITRNPIILFIFRYTLFML